MEIPDGLKIRSDAIITIDPSEDNLGFYPREDYLLIEITGQIKQSIFRTRKLVAAYTKQHDKENLKPIAFRAIGQGIGASITLVHLMRTEEENLYDDNLSFNTFSVKNNQRDKIQTGIQIILFPKNKKTQEN
ncbi:MAG: hypothetical protein ACFFD1_01405 [Candidatus Thorarchaeota archaeon]